jgi:hypothetical protein
MSRTRAYMAAGIAGLLAIAGAGAASAAASAATGPQWHIVKSVKTSSGAFTAVVATGKATGWAFGGNNPGTAPTAWELAGGKWTHVAFPGLKTENVVYAAATSPANVWAFASTVFGTQSRVLRWTGSKWSAVKTLKGGITGATVLGTLDVWVYGPGVWHYNGHAWTQVNKTFGGGSALSDTSVWAYTTTSVEHWNGRSWSATSVKALLPAKMLLNNPSIIGILAVSATNVWVVGNGGAEDQGGPFVVLHYDGSKWRRLAEGGEGYGAGQQFSLDGSGGLWIPMPGSDGEPSAMLHYTDGKLKTITMPQKADVVSISRMAGTTEQFAGGYVPVTNPVGAGLAEVILQYS